MANFEISNKITGGNEGGYANNPSDTGGETYAGISRNNWPNWVGWVIIDSIKKTYGTTAKIINQYAKANNSLQPMIDSFYKQNFWDVNKLDLVNDQQIANTVYDFGVNSGVGRAAKYLQEAINNVGKVNIDVDGKIGKNTLSYTNSLDPKSLHTEFNAKRKAFYLSIAKGNQAQFLNSWLSRIKPYK